MSTAAKPAQTGGEPWRCSLIRAANGLKAMGLIVNDDSGWKGQLILDTIGW